MSKSATLNAAVRATANRGEIKQLRRDGVIPAVIYGPKQDPTSLQIKTREIEVLLGHAVGENILVDLAIDDGGNSTTTKALIQEVQHHPVTGNILHVDLMAVSMDEKITAHIPVEPTGTSVGVKSFGGLLEQGLRTFEVECLPADLPEVITVDISSLNIGDSIHVEGVKMPSGVVVLDNPDVTVFHVLAPRVEAEVEAAPAAAPEVIKEKKTEAE